MNALVLTALWLGCSRPGADVVQVDAPPVAVRAVLERKPEGGGGVLVVRVEHDRDVDIDLPTPVASGLTFELVDTPELEPLGARNVVTQRFRFSGSRGHYEIPPIAVAYPGADGETATARSDAIFLDLETDPVEVGTLEDIVEAPETGNGVPGLLALLGGVVGGLLYALWPKGRPAEVVKRPPLPPHLAALHAWEAVRADAERTDEDKARELSVIFRRYVEAVLRFEATALTTSEILQRLLGLTRLPKGNVPRAKRLLRATDRIKFAEERPTDELIDELDADLRAFIEATRPSTVRSA
ncbi:MAG: hypothetical protein AAF602_02425 [Myxococcota bacterium]